MVFGRHTRPDIQVKKWGDLSYDHWSQAGEINVA